jgi:uncharacterized protein YndB with AHSA1/START domain
MSIREHVGLTQAQGWEIGARRTFAVTGERAWQAVMTQPGLGCWLGHVHDLKPAKGVSFVTAEGGHGHIISFAEGSLIRLRWQPQGANHVTTVQVRVTPAGEKATISFHQERLTSAEERIRMRRYWAGALDRLGALLAA